LKLALVDTFEQKGSTSPLGLASIATYLRDKGNFNHTKIIDVAIENVMKTIRSYKPDAVGVSAYTTKYNFAVSLAKKIKQNFDIPVFVGGIHISLLPESLNSVFNFGVIGEGEETMLHIVSFLEGERNIESVDGVVYYKNGTLKLNKPRKLIRPLDAIPIPDRDFVSERYFTPLKYLDGRFLVEGNMLTSRGCVYRCPFCASSRFWKGLRVHSTKRVVEEIAYLKEKYKVDCVNIWDDFFTFSKKRVKEIVFSLRKEKLTEDIEYRVQVRVNSFDDEMAMLLKEMNVVNVNFGFESGSQKILNKIKKDVTVNKIKDCIVRGKKFGLLVTGSFIFGIPNETVEDMKLTLKLLDYATRNGVYAWFFVATPYPSTDWFSIAEEKGVVSKNMDWTKLDLKRYNRPLLLDSSVKVGEYRKIIFEAQKKVDFVRLHTKNKSYRKILKVLFTNQRRVVGVVNEVVIRAIEKARRFLIAP